MKRMLVAYDGSAAAKRALAHAATFALPDDAVTVVNVMPEPGISAQIGPPTEQRNRQWQLLDDARKGLATHGINATAADPVGDAATEIVATARQLDTDVIIIGRDRHKTPHVRGSTSARVVRAAHCDVLVVLTDGYTPWPPLPPAGSVVVTGLLGRDRDRLPPTPAWMVRVECVP